MKITNKLKIKKPILIKQLSGYGEAFDFAIIVNKKDLFKQFGINKDKSDIVKI